jgi:hypothetical protein
MAATFVFSADHGTATGSPAKGTTRTTNVTDVNWKNSDVHADTYSSYPITDGANSYEIWLFGHFSGSYNQISAGLFAHTAGTFGSGLTLKGPPAGSSQLTYTTPSTTANSNLTTTMTSAISIGSGTLVHFGGTGPETASKTSSTTANPAYTNWLTTQLQTSGAAAGDTTQVTLTLQYNEN